MAAVAATAAAACCCFCCGGGVQLGGQSRAHGTNLLSRELAQQGLALQQVAADALEADVHVGELVIVVLAAAAAGTVRSAFKSHLLEQSRDEAVPGRLGGWCGSGRMEQAAAITEEMSMRIRPAHLSSPADGAAAAVHRRSGVRSKALSSRHTLAHTYTHSHTTRRRTYESCRLALGWQTSRAMMDMMSFTAVCASRQSKCWNCAALGRTANEN
jgi:hypothetical protein